MELLFSLTKKDFEVQTFCTGGKGGQHRNAKKNGVRIIHTASGATAEHRDGRDQAKNKTAAFEKLTKTKKFTQWHKAEVAKHLGLAKQIEERVEEQMRPDNLKVETYDARPNN
jgi:protein subunit release factor A